MTWIIVLLVIGILLVFAEVFFVPGTTVVGIMGVIFAAFGIYMTYRDYGANTGHILLAATLAVFTVAIIYGAKSGVWEKLSIEDAISGKVNVVKEHEVDPGNQGITISAIRPIGKARINGKNYEVRSLGQFIDSGTKVEVIKVVGNVITVKPLDDASGS